MPEGELTLGQVADRIVMLDIICDHCGRRGCLSTARLVANHGRWMTMPELLDILARDCDRRKSGSLYQTCGAHFPQLPVLFKA